MVFERRFYDQNPDGKCTDVTDWESQLSMKYVSNINAASTIEVMLIHYLNPTQPSVRGLFSSPQHASVRER